MRIRHLLIPIALTAALVSGCAKASTPSTPASPTATVLTSPPGPPDNGVSALSATEILDKAKAAALAKGSVRVKGSADDSGNKITLDFKISGTNFDGTLSMKDATIHILKVGTSLYL